MEIIKFKKTKGNRYAIFFDTGLEVSLYDDVIVAFNLLVNKKMDEKTFQSVTNLNDEYDTYYQALAYLRTKMRTKKELEKYLKEKKFSQAMIVKTLKRLEKEGYLNETVYVQAFLNDQLHFTTSGPLKIVSSLEKLGIDEQIVGYYISQVEEDVWKERISKIISKKERTNHNLGMRRLKEKLIFDLHTLGYHKDMILEVMEDYSFSEKDEVLQKEFQKLLLKLSKKYQGNELDYQIRQKLYQKGFSVDKINELLKKRVFD